MNAEHPQTQYSEETGKHHTEYKPETSETVYSDEYVQWLESKLQQAQKPEESRQLIQDFLRVYVFTVNDEGYPTAKTGEIMALIQRAQNFLTD